TPDPSRTGLRPARRQGCVPTAPAASGLTSSQGAGDATASVAVGGCASFRPSWPSVVAAWKARVEATAAWAAAPRVNAAVAPTAAFPISSRRESIVHSFRQLRTSETLADMHEDGALLLIRADRQAVHPSPQGRRSPVRRSRVLTMSGSHSGGHNPRGPYDVDTDPVNKIVGVFTVSVRARRYFS